MRISRTNLVKIPRYHLRKANKPHACSDCDRKIVPGEYYLRGITRTEECLCWQCTDFDVPTDSTGLEYDKRTGGLVYLASPYSHPLEYVRQTRFEQACAAAAALMRRGVYVFSPIAHTHPIACAGKLPTGWDFWQPYDRLYLQACERMIVLQLEGWEESKGVSDEIFIMQTMGKPIEYVTLEELLEGGTILLEDTPCTP